MCGRYSLSSAAELVREAFGVDAAGGELPPRWNIAPSQEAPVVRLDDGGARALHGLRWGLIAEEADEPVSGLINARAETAAALPSFREAFRRRRCLVPADGFYEWLKLEGSRYPFHIRRRDRSVMAFAGLWGRWAAPARATVESFTILTCPPAELVRPLHDRMPVILPPESWDVWLDPGAEATRLQELLVAWRGEELEAVPVSSYVNRADNEGPECVHEVPAPVARQLSLLPP
jgi:putative SOS response-associated peptidase YedK